MSPRRSAALSSLVVILLAGLVATVGAAAEDEPEAAGLATLDEGRLDPAWFGGELAFVKADAIDYLWVKEGFTVAGRSFHFVPWPKPELLGADGAKRSEDDHDLAKQMSAVLHEMFAREWGRAWAGAGATTSLESGDVTVEGRVVDCATGSRAAKMLVGFGAGAGSTVIDLKLTDTASGELLAAIHNRVVSGTSWSTTDSKLKKWIGKAGEAIADKGFAGLYAEGKPVKE